MKVDLNILSPVRRKVDVELPAEVVDEEFSRVCGSLSQRARIKGFRPGKIPRTVLQGVYGDEIKSRVLSQLVDQTLREVFKEKGLQVVAQPEVEAQGLTEGQAFSFSAVVEVKPDFDVGNYLGLELEQAKQSVKDEQVEETLRRLQEARARLEPVEGREVVERGDCVLIDFTGSIEGKPFSGNKGENYLLEVGGGNAVTDFENGLVGLNKGVEHSMRVAYPEDYFNREMAGKSVDFLVTAREIKKKILQPLDDEFAKDHGESGSLAELKQKIRDQLETELREIRKRGLKAQILTRLIDGHTFEIPSTLVDQEIRYLMRRYQSAAASSSPGQAEGGPSTEELRKELEPQARRSVQGSLLVEKISALEGIQVSDQDLQRRIDESIRLARDQGSQLREIYGRAEVREELRSQMVYDRTLDYLVERAAIKEVEPEKTKVDEQGKKR
jgi:trigger factor